MPGSQCDHLLIRPPYVHGPDLEHCPMLDGHARKVRRMSLLALVSQSASWTLKSAGEVNTHPGSKDASKSR
ncbi:hypothetical protein [Streptomyces sp. NPDC001675]